MSAEVAAGIREPAELAELVAQAREVAAQVAGRPFLVVAAGGTGIASEALGAPVLDSSLPDAVHEVLRGLDLTQTVFVLQSRQGADSELNPIYRHLCEQGAKQFIAVAGAGSSLPSLAEQEQFSLSVTAPEGSGSRLFALVAAALRGEPLEVGAGGDPQAFGAALVALARGGHDKLTLLLSQKLAPLGPALEQLIARATGKDGRGLIPVDEPPAPLEHHGKDRAFVSVWLGGKHAQTQQRKLEKLAQAGHPVLGREAHSPLSELLFWESAAAAAAQALGVDPEAEPQLKAGKDFAKALLARVTLGRLPEEDPQLHAGGISLFCTPAHASLLRSAAGTLGPLAAASPSHWLAAHLALADAGEHLALCGYFPKSAQDQLRRLQLRVREATRLPSAVALGPRYLHSTGQLLKGGPPGPVIVLGTYQSSSDLPVPGMPFGFATHTEAQARGDELALRERGRRVLRVHSASDDWQRFFATLDEAVALISK